jgi:trigger factor
MNITVTDQPQCKKQLRLEIPGEQVKAETDTVATQLARQVNVPGFRRGHVPKSVIKTRFRKELRDEVLSHLLPHALTDAIKEKDLKVVGEPSLDDLKFGDDESINVTFTVEVAPDFEVSSYRSLPLTRRVYKVRDEDVDKVIDTYRERHAELVPVEDRGAQPGDIITANISGRFEAETEQAGAASGEGGEGEAAQGEAKADEAKASEAKANEAGAGETKEVNQQDVEIELGGEGVLKQFTEALTGARAGDERTFTVDYTPDYAAKEYAGRRVDYKVDVVSVRVKELPVLDDDFVSSVNEDFKTLDELRSDVRTRLEHEAEHKTDAELRNGVLEQLVNRNRFDVPEVIVERQMNQRLNTFVRQLAGQGMDPRRLKIDWNEIRESQRERAEREVRASFILDRIAVSENIDVSEDELDQELRQIAENVGEDVAALRARLTKEETLDSIKEQVRNRKALDLVIASADMRTEEVEGLGGEEAKTGEGGQADE